jgi:alpha-beta hydrolase superfamily lysophospholipase
MENPAFAEADLVFLGYESRSRAAAYNVDVIYQIVNALAEMPGNVLKQVRGPLREEEFAYESIVLVGHSLGGALVRDVAMSAKNEGKPWADKLRLALFAPAHMGASVIDLAQMSFGFLKWSGIAQAAAILANPVLRDLQRGSDYLKALLATAQEIGVHCTTKAKLVVHASGDKVVILNRFYRDPPAQPYEGQNHVSCCKPMRAVFESPVVDVAKVLT